MIDVPIDLRLGSPCDPPPACAVRAMNAAGDSLGPYGKSVGSPEFRCGFGLDAAKEGQVIGLSIDWSNLTVKVEVIV